MKVPEEAVEQLAAEQGPRWSSRKEAWLDGYRHGEQQARMTGAATEAIRAQERERIREALMSDEAADAAWEKGKAAIERADRDGVFPRWRGMLRAAFDVLESSDD